MGKARTTSRRRAQSAAADSSRMETWPPPPLTASERAYMIRKAKEASVALVDHAHTLDGPVQWHYTGKFRGIQMYRGEGSFDHAGTMGTEFLCGVTTMMGSIEQVAEYFDQQTTDDMVAKKAEDVLDCCMLYSLMHGDVKNPFYRVSAKYQLYEGPSAFSRERDYCFLECQNTFRHASGRRGWVLSMHSIKLPCCPEVDGVVRGSMYQSGYVFVEAERDGYMDVMHSLQINFKSTSRLPHFLLNSALKRRILSVVTISREIQTSRMGRQTLLRKKDLMPKRARALCANCSRKFSLFVRKTRCRVCGEVVCQPCAPPIVISTSQGPTKTRVCTNCCHHKAPVEDYEPDYEDSRRLQNHTRYSDILQDQHDHPDMYHEDEEDSMDEDGDEDGLEEQSDYSVFAQSRFTDASRDSMAASQLNASKYQYDPQYDSSSHFDTSSVMDESQYYLDGSSDSSYVSDISGTSSTYWQDENSAASGTVGWKKASSVHSTESMVYDPQSSGASSNLYRSKTNHGNGNSAMHAQQRNRRFKATPILEDELSGHTIQLETSGDDLGDSIQSTDDNSSQVSEYQAFERNKATNKDASRSFKSFKGSQSSSSQGSQNSDTSQKTVSIQILAKARSARYGIKSDFPLKVPPPPPSPLQERSVSGRRLHRNKNDSHSSKGRNSKGIATRKVLSSSPTRGSRSSHRAPNVPHYVALPAAVAKRDSFASHSSSRDSTRSSGRMSASREQVRRNRGQTLQLPPDGHRSFSVRESIKEENLNRLRAFERLEESRTDKPARRSMVPSDGRSSPIRSSRSGQSDRRSAAMKPEQEQQRLSSRRSRAAINSTAGPPPGSPPGTPPSMRNRQLHVPNALGNSRSIHGSQQRPDVSRKLARSRSNESKARISSAPSTNNESVTFYSQRSGRRTSTSRASINQSSYGGKRLNASQTRSTPMSSHRRNPAFDVSQLSVDRFKFSSSIAILETPGGSPELVTMMERPSLQSSLGDSLLKEDLLDQSSSGLKEHINSIRARGAFKIPDEEFRPSVELRQRRDEHHKRMKELSNLAVKVNVPDSSSTLGGLLDRSFTLTNRKSGRGVSSPGSTSSVSSTSSVNIDDDDFDSDKQTRPIGRMKRSGTFAFALEAVDHVADMTCVDGQNENLRGLETGKRVDYADPSFSSSAYCDDDLHKSESAASMFKKTKELERNIEQRSGLVTPPLRLSEDSAKDENKDRRLSPRLCDKSIEHGRALDSLAFRPSEESVDNGYEQKSSFNTSSYRSGKIPMTGFVNKTHYQIDEHVDSNEDFADAHRLNDEKAEKQEHQDMRLNAAYRSSEESIEPNSELMEHQSKNASSTSPLSKNLIELEAQEQEHRSSSRLSKEYKNRPSTPPCRQSIESIEHSKANRSGFNTPPRRLSGSKVSRRHPTTPPHRQSKKVGNFDSSKALSPQPHRQSGEQVSSSPRRQSEEYVDSEYDRRLSASLNRKSEDFIKFEYNSEPARSPPRQSENFVEHDKDKELAALPRRQSEESYESEYERVSIASPPRQSEKSVEYENETELTALHDCQSEDSVESEYERELATSLHRKSEESVEYEYKRGISSSPRQSEEYADYEYERERSSMPYRQSEDSAESEYERGFTSLPRRPSEDSVEYEYERKLNALPSRFSEESVESSYEEELSDMPQRPSKDSMEYEYNRESGALPNRLSEESVESEYEEGELLLMLHGQSEGFVKHEYENEPVDTIHGFSKESADEHNVKHSNVETTPSSELSKDVSRTKSPDEQEDFLARRAHDNLTSENHKVVGAVSEGLGHENDRASILSSESEPEDVEALYRSSEDQTATSALKFHFSNSQLAPGEGGGAVDEFLAESYNAVSRSKFLAQVDEHEEYTRSPRDPSSFPPALTDDHATTRMSTNSDRIDGMVSSSRMSNVSVLDEELLNRPTIELFDLIRANRIKPSTDEMKSSDMMHDLETSHLRRMEELNRIAVDQLGNRISSLNEDMLGSALQPVRVRKLDCQSARDDMQWCSSSLMEEVQTKHEVDMDKLHRRIRELEAECRESFASVLTREEMNLSEFDSDDDGKLCGLQSQSSRPSFNPHSSYMCASDLSASTISEHMSDDESEVPPLPAHTLLQQITRLRHLQQKMNQVEDKDTKEYRERLKEQYRELRSIQANGARHERASLGIEMPSEENWV